MKHSYLTKLKRETDEDERIQMGQRLRTKRTFLGLTQEDVAAKIGITTTAYSKIERGESGVNLDRLNQICNVLSIDVRNILHEPTHITLSDLYVGIRSITNNIEKISAWIVSEKPQIYRVADTGKVVSKQEFTMQTKDNSQTTEQTAAQPKRGRKRRSEKVVVIGPVKKRKYTRHKNNGSGNEGKV